MAKNKRSKPKPSRPPRQPKPQSGRRNGGRIDNAAPVHVYGGSSAYVPGNRLLAHGTMADEVRNTLSHRREFAARGDSRLRHQPVVFVCAGFMDPLKDFEVNHDELVAKPARPAMSKESGPSSKLVASVSAIRAKAPESSAAHSGDALPSLDEPSFFIDVTGDKSIAIAAQHSDSVSAVPESCHDSDSSDDVILFKGREQARQAPLRGGLSRTPADSLNLPELTVEIDHIRQDAVSRDSSKSTDASRKTHVPKSRTPKPLPNVSDDFLAFSDTTTRPRRGSPPPVPLDAGMLDDEAAIIADYIANMHDEHDSDEEAVNSYPGLGSHAFHMLRDLGGSDSEAIPARGLVEEDSSRSSENDEDDEDDDDDAEDDRLAVRRHAEAQDAKLARLLAKQEELGLGGDDIVLVDDADSVGDDMGEWQIAPKQTPRRRKKGSLKQARIVQKKGQYPTASKMADAFDDLDLMDWHRPSLNNFKNIGKHNEPEFDVSDSDLEEAMAIAWKKDRLRKAEKKKAREELRSQGLLGKHANPEDLRIKYRGGMSIDDMEVEFEAFLVGPREQLHLPPFDKKSRQTVHLIANKFKIKSQSAGKGNTRCPVLYRTKATLAYEPDFFNNVFSRIKQSWFPRVDVDDQTVSDAKIFRARSEVGAARAKKRGAVHVREGDVVGQHASELGVDNKGRAMLEKMGWSKGMALGTDDNRGIIVPITHVVKKGKAGLGDA